MSETPKANPPTPLAPTRIDGVMPRGLLARLRIRNKLIVLHTMFTLALAAILMLALRPAVDDVVHRAEQAAASALVQQFGAPSPDATNGGVIIESGTARQLGLGSATLGRLAASDGQPVVGPDRSGRATAVIPIAKSPEDLQRTLPSVDVLGAALPGNSIDDEPRYLLAEARLSQARRAVTRLQLLTILALIGVYLLVALALEGLIMPRHVYGPIRHMLRADRAVQAGVTDEEMIPDEAMPADELGEIMRSRNQSIRTMREQEHQLAAALDQLEAVANDLARKNHLLENARRNLVDADRLASLGMLSAGIAHELNTPLAVLKGLVEKLEREPESLTDAQRALMLRVVGRLEGLGEGLLDFARVRPARTSPAEVRAIVEEAATLIRLDREASQTEVQNRVESGMTIECDAARLVQVFVNLLRNAIDAARDHVGSTARVIVSADTIERDGTAWASITVADNGPGISPALLASIFEPFVSTRLDARGTGLGLAVAHGIVAEHGGRLLARNAQNGGAVFEALIPLRANASDREHPGESGTISL